ncbi:MAG: hypothetical protein GY952_15395 [Rhodobacteraceae bacterium]|nr:hypothetical protein [Paracoccaceae bacterium]
MDGLAEQLNSAGWVKFPYDPKLAEWVRQITPAAQACAADPKLLADWLRCDRTWFVGVNCLPNNESGAVGASGPLRGNAIDFIKKNVCPEHVNWDRAQISICYQGYPRPWDQESEAAQRFRRTRGAAHVDGLMRGDPSGARKLKELHRFLLGIPLLDVPKGAAPFVVWEGSHERIRAAFLQAYKNHPPDDWPNIDVVEIYKQTRREIFETCRRVEIPAKPGEAYVVHRMALHGMAPWPDDLEGPKEGRMIAYFRPTDGISPEDWLNLP